MADINLDNFVTLERQAKLTALKPGTFNVKSTSITVAEDIMKRFRITDDDDQVVIVFQYNEEAKAIRLVSPKEVGEGFVFKTKRVGWAGIGNLPSAFKLMNIPKGVYKAYGDKYPDVYIYVGKEDLTEEDDTPESRYFIEEEPEVGDIVSWIGRLDKRDDGERTLHRAIVTGRVTAIFEKASILMPTTANKEPQMTMWAQIQPISKSWSDVFPERSTTVMKLDKLIIREKANV